MELAQKVQNLLTLVNQKVTTPTSSKVQLPSNNISLGELA
jgi:hypothetical protein